MRTTINGTSIEELKVRGADLEKRGWVCTHPISPKITHNSNNGRYGEHFLQHTTTHFSYFAIYEKE